MNKFSKKMLILVGVAATGLVLQFLKESKDHKNEGKAILRVLKNNLE